MWSGYQYIPDYIHERIAACPTTTFFVGKSRNYSRADIEAGLLAHLGISWNEAGLQTPAEPIIPPAEQGRWSKRNLHGRINVLRDEPKIEKVIGGWPTPNFGDWSKGSHTHYSVRQVFQKETWWGQGLAIRVTPGEPEADEVQIGFIVDRVFDRQTPDSRNLLMACSLLRENTGANASILSTATSVADWLSSQRVTWEFLPVGDLGPNPHATITARLKVDPDSPRARRAVDRFDKVANLGATDIITGEGEFTRYFGLKFRDDLVALECLDYGNALYLMYKDWEVLSQRSRIDLLADTTADYDRVVHRVGWEGRLAALLRGAGHILPGTDADG